MADVTWHLPEPDPETAPFWEAAGEGRLLIKECVACGQVFFYPRAHCPRCWSADTVWREASGRGTVYTFTVIHQNDLPPFRDRVPYVVAIVELEEGVRMTSNVEGCPPEQVVCGMPVQVDFRGEWFAHVTIPEKRHEQRTYAIPVFRPA